MKNEMPIILKEALSLLNIGYMVFDRKNYKKLAESDLIFSSNIQTKNGVIKLKHFNNKKFSNIFPEKTCVEINRLVQTKTDRCKKRKIGKMSFFTENKSKYVFEISYLTFSNSYFLLLISNVKKVNLLSNVLEGKIASLESTIKILKGEKKTLYRKISESKVDTSKIVHDLKSPLSSIIGFGELIKEEAGSKNQNEIINFSEKIIKNSDRLKKLIQQILKSNPQKKSINQKKLKLYPLDYFIIEASNELSYQILAKKAHIIYSNLPSICVEKVDFIKVFRNLLSNSLKYSKKKINPIINIDFKPFYDKKNSLISVRDNGIGVEENRHKDIMLLYSKVDSKNKDSSGYGLTICSDIIKKYGGDMKIESKINQGTIILTILPTAMFL